MLKAGFRGGTSGMLGAVPAVGLLLPRGRRLPADAWQRRHRLILALLWLHTAALPVFGVVMGLGVVHSVAEVLPIALAAVGASARRLGHRAQGAVASLGLITASAVLVHFSGGYVEMHFHFFVMLAVIAMYQDWLPYTLAIGYVALHHGLVGALFPTAVYNHADAIANPWKWASIHAVFVLAASAASIANWRLHERDREGREASEARLRLVMGQVPAVLWATDAALRLTAVQGADRTLQERGQGAEGLVGRRLQEWLGTEEPTEPRLAAHLRALGGASAVYEHERGGRFFRAQVDPLRGADGEITGTVAAEVDITEVREAEEERARLLEQERDTREELETVHRIGQVLSGELELPALVQGVTDFTTQVTGAQFGAFFYNQVDERGEQYTLYALAGVPREAFERFPMPRNTAVFGPTFRGEGIVRSDDITKDPRYGQNAPYHGMPPGHLPVVSYLAVPVVSRTGEVVGGLFFGHAEAGRFTARHENIVGGIATQTAIALDNARLYQEAREAVRARDEFLSIAAHELRTPITGIKTSAQLVHRMLDRGGFDEGRLRYLAGAQVSAAGRMATLVNELLDVSRIRSGALTLRLEPTDVAALLRRTVEEYGQQVGASDRLELEVPDGGCVVAADAGRMEQVFLNLLENAVKYSPDGGVVRVRVTVGDGGVELRVRDEGIGIPVDALETIFQPFGRAKNAAARNLPGMGLGLYISRNIVERHGGQLRAESAGEGTGTTLVLTLPSGSGAGEDSRVPVDPGVLITTELPAATGAGKG